MQATNLQCPARPWQWHTTSTTTTTTTGDSGGGSGSSSTPELLQNRQGSRRTRIFRECGEYTIRCIRTSNNIADISDSCTTHNTDERQTTKDVSRPCGDVPCGRPGDYTPTALRLVCCCGQPQITFTLDLHNSLEFSDVLWP